MTRDTRIATAPAPGGIGKTRPLTTARGEHRSVYEAQRSAPRHPTTYWSGRPPRRRISATYSPSEEPACGGVDPYLISTTAAPFEDSSSSTRLISRSRLPRTFVWATLTRTRVLG